MATAGVKGIKN